MVLYILQRYVENNIIMYITYIVLQSQKIHDSWTRWLVITGLNSFSALLSTDTVK